MNTCGPFPIGLGLHAQLSMALLGQNYMLVNGNVCGCDEPEGTRPNRAQWCGGKYRTKARNVGKRKKKRPGLG